MRDGIRGIKKAVLGYQIENGKSGASASELAEVRDCLCM